MKSEPPDTVVPALTAPLQVFARLKNFTTRLLASAVVLMQWFAVEK